MHNIVMNLSEKFHDHWLKNDRALGYRKSDNNNPKDTTQHIRLFLHWIWLGSELSKYYTAR